LTFGGSSLTDRTRDSVHVDGCWYGRRREAVIESERCDRRPIMIRPLILRRNNRTAKPTPSRANPVPAPQPASPIHDHNHHQQQHHIDSVNELCLDNAKPRFHLHRRVLSLPYQLASSENILGTYRCAYDAGKPNSEMNYGRH